MLRILALASAFRTAWSVGCTADEQCYLTSEWRCVEDRWPLVPAEASPCVLDRGYNLTGYCSCGQQRCSNLTAPSPSPNKKQYLVIGDSVSNGYFKTLKDTLEGTGKWEVFHAPGNNDNTNFGRRCLEGWLGADPKRWDVISMNWGLHDLAFPDNEHLEVATYASLLTDIRKQLDTLTKQDVNIFWVATTPCPTNPPPGAKGQNCTLLPGRLETDVLRYNAAAAEVLQDIPVCDLHKVVNDHCGVGYAACDIAQCAGPHFVGDGFPMLGRALAKCVSANSEVLV